MEQAPLLRLSETQTPPAGRAGASIEEMFMKKTHVYSVSLPTSGYFITISPIFYSGKREWGKEELEAFLSLRERVQSVYGLKNGHPDKVPPLYVEGISADQAISRMMPMKLKIMHEDISPGSILGKSDHGIEILGHTAGKRSSAGIRLTLISKEKGVLEPTEELSDIISPILNGLCFNNLDVRSNREIIAAASRLVRPFKGLFRLVAVPVDRKVRLTRNSQGEYVSEIPEIWA